MSSDESPQIVYRYLRIVLGINLILSIVSFFISTSVSCVVGSATDRYICTPDASGLGMALALFGPLGILIYGLLGLRKMPEISRKLKIRYALSLVIVGLGEFVAFMLLMNGRRYSGIPISEAEDQALAEMSTIVFPFILVSLVLFISVLVKMEQVKRADPGYMSRREIKEARIHSEKTSKFERIIKRSDSIEIDQLAALLDLEKNDLLSWLYDLPLEFGFTIKQNIIEFNQENIDKQIDDLLTSFERMEQSKKGKT